MWTHLIRFKQEIWVVDGTASYFSHNFFSLLTLFASHGQAIRKVCRPFPFKAEIENNFTILRRTIILIIIVYPCNLPHSFRHVMTVFRFNNELSIIATSDSIERKKFPLISAKFAIFISICLFFLSLAKHFLHCLMMLKSLMNLSGERDGGMIVQSNHFIMFWFVMGKLLFIGFGDGEIPKVYFFVL